MFDVQRLTNGTLSLAFWAAQHRVETVLIDPWDKSSTPLFKKNFTGTQVHPFIYVLSVVAFALQQRSWAVATKTIWPKSPKCLPKGLLQKKFANTCVRKLIHYKQAGPPVLGSTPPLCCCFLATPWNWMCTSVNAIWADRSHFEPHYYMPWKMYTSHPQHKPSIFDNIQL